MERTAADQAIDSGRKPEAFISALDVKEGMRVGEIIALGGYTTELLARAVGHTGTVYAQNPKMLLDKGFGVPWAERLKRDVNGRVVNLERDMNDPFGKELDGRLDLVVTNANYHDLIWQKADSKKMNTAVFAALRSGGRYVVCDSSAAPGTGTAHAETLHRIDEEWVKKDVESAGFKFTSSNDLLRNPADTRDWNASPRAAADKRGTNDRFILIFTKP